jgi:hypothetical protein
VLHLIELAEQRERIGLVGEPRHRGHQRVALRPLLADHLIEHGGARIGGDLARD